MKKLFILAALITALPAAYAFAGGGETPTNFSGSWVLNTQKTQDVPSRLQSYKMNVTQTGQQIIVESKVEGGSVSEPEAGGDDGGGGYPGGGRQGGNYPGGGYPGGGGYPDGGGGYPGGGGRFPGGGGGVGFPGGGVGFPGGRRGGGYPRGGGARSEQMRKGMAFMAVLPKATYNLDGTKTTTDIDKPIPGSATLQAAWKKSGQQLDLSRVEDLRGGDGTVKIKEQWSLSKDGMLEIERNVSTPRGSAKVKMFFTKEESASAGAQ